MKVTLVIALLFWLFCGLIGAWMLGELGIDNWKEVVGGPMTLSRALNG
jgi:hypothetical protein